MTDKEDIMNWYSAAGVDEFSRTELLQEIVRTLESVVPEDAAYTGICEAVDELAYFTDVPLAMASNYLWDDLKRDAFEAWPESSGSYVWPVPHPSKEPEDAYEDANRDGGYVGW